MLENITFKTELNEIITVEEVAVLFDSIRKKYDSELVSLSLFPVFNQIRKKIIDKTLIQRNKELSKLLSEIVRRKQEIKINIWKTLSEIGCNKKSIQNSKEKSKDLEQIIYEEEQIINVYENSIRTLERKEKKIMNGKYSRLDKLKTTSRKRSLKKQLEELKSNLISISSAHDDCFGEFIDELENLVKGTIVTEETFPRLENQISIEQYANTQSIIIEEELNFNANRIDDENKQSKDFYQYEPNKEDLDDELIYQLLSPGKYSDKDGTINGLLTQDFLEYEEV